MYRTRKWLKPFIIIIDIIGNIIFFFLRFRKLPKKTQLKIAILRFEYFGDLLLSFPFYKNLKLNYPDCQITVFCRTSAKPLIAGNSNIDTIIELNTPWFSRGDNDGYSEVCKSGLKYFNNFDIVFDLHPDPRNILLARIIGKYTVGFGTRGLSFLLNREVPFKAGKSIVLRYLDLLSAIEGKIISTETEIFSSEYDKGYIKKLLQNINGKIICINPGVSCQSRTWPDEYFSELINSLLLKYLDISIILVDVKNDDRIKKIISKIQQQNKTYNFAGLCSAMQFVELVRAVDIYIGLESFGIHVAAAVKIPVVDIHSGVTDKEEMGPYSEKKAVLQKILDCSYCGKDFCEDNICMKEIKPEEVLNSVEAFTKNWSN